ncbi:MAG: MBL fold metallo-hydrolase [Exilispira sp.]|jgi:L-ascorbate metabolism protein UlaG (beta-lactamase superfamily)|nr:MBL fold metallo-hydrolase [Exilispira sp.]
MLQGVYHLGHASIKIQKSLTIYIDPFNIKEASYDADLIFCTHSHYDHLSVQDIRKVAKSNSIIILPNESEDKAKELNLKILTVEPGKDYSVSSISFTTTYAYNIGKQFHPKEKKWVGYIIKIDNIKYYIAGDTDSVPEIQNLTVDVAFLPVGGTYTMNWKEAALLANKLKPRYAIPIHFGDVVGSISDANSFAEQIQQPTEAKILR